jgi:hypothetical protein
MFLLFLSGPSFCEDPGWGKVIPGLGKKIRGVSIIYDEDMVKGIFQMTGMERWG